MSTAAEIVAHVRRERDLSMSVLAERADVSRSTVSRIESGKLDPSYTLLQRIVKAAGYRIEMQPRNAATRETRTRPPRTVERGHADARRQ
jgi:transcriptional regulator with XRE-family HTH domain